MANFFYQEIDTGSPDSFILIGKSIFGGNGAGQAVFQRYLRQEPLPQLAGAIGFDPEADRLVLDFDKPESAQVALDILRALAL